MRVPKEEYRTTKEVEKTATRQYPGTAAAIGEKECTNKARMLA